MSAFTHRLTGPDSTVLVLATPAYLDHSVADELRSEVIRLAPDRDGGAVVLDMQRTELMTSIGIAALLQIDEFCSDHRLRLALFGLTGKITELLTMLNLNKRFRVYEGEAEALGYAGGS